MKIFTKKGLTTILVAPILFVFLAICAHTVMVTNEMNKIRADGGYYAVDTDSQNDFGLPTIKWVAVK